MPSCPTVHEHPSFKIPTKNSKYPKLIRKLKRFLKSDSGHAIGEYKRYELSPLKGFQRGALMKDAFSFYVKIVRRKL